MHTLLLRKKYIPTKNVLTMTFKGGWNICATVDHEEIAASRRQRDDDLLTGEDDLVARKGDDDMTDAEAAPGGAAQLKQMLENVDNHGG